MTEARKLDTNRMMLKTQKKGLSFRPEIKDYRQLSVDIKMKYKIKTSFVNLEGPG